MLKFNGIFLQKGYLSTEAVWARSLTYNPYEAPQRQKPPRLGRFSLGSAVILLVLYKTGLAQPFALYRTNGYDNFVL